MKRIVYALLISIVLLVIKQEASTPFGGGVTGAGQDQRALVSGYKYSPLRQGPARPSYNRRWWPQGRVLIAGPSKARYFKRYRYIQEDPNPSTVHSRR